MRRVTSRLEAWLRVDKSDPEAIASFLKEPSFPALEQLANTAMQRAAEAKQHAFERALAERRTREAAEAESRWQAEAAAKRQREEDERRLGPGVAQARDAAKAGRPVAERVFRLELPGVAGWPRPELVTLPPGRFLMGAAKGEEGASSDEFPQHEVRIDHVFALGKHAVTFAEWDAVVAAGAGLRKLSDNIWGRGSRPVIKVSWEDAQAYVAWLNERLGLTGRLDAYRLPSEAEWEYACRAGTTTPFSFGATISTAQANYDGDHTYGAGKKGECRQRTMPVGSFPANGFGLHEMHGNVWEWCEDTYQRNYEGAPADGSAWTGPDSSSRVVRGGSWYNGPQNLRSAIRDRYTPSVWISVIGFRLARTVLPSNP